MLKKIERTGHETAASKSAVRDLRNSLLALSNLPEQQLEILFPKKGKVVIYKMKAGEDRRAEHVVVEKSLHFIYIEEICIPILKTLHSYPNMYPRFTADEGAIRFILKGAHVMCPGLTNQNASMDEVERGAVVSLYVKNHENALAIGVTKMSTKEIRETNEGVAVEVFHYVGDGLWSILYTK